VIPDASPIAGTTHLPLLAAAGFVSGVMNALAGGGSFVSFPALVFAGLPSVIANASSTVALFPGTLASLWVYRRDLASPVRLSLASLLAVSVAGGLAGAILLLSTPQIAFNAIIPWLLLFATLTFAFGRDIGAALQRHIRIGPATLLITQFILGLYGGYFGGAVGIMMMAAWSLLGTVGLKAMNPAKTLLVGAANAVAVLCFILAGAVRWPETLVMLVAAVAGGYGGARAARFVPPRAIRAGIIVITITMTLLLFYRLY